MTFYPTKRIDRESWEGEWPLTKDVAHLQRRAGDRVVLIADRVYAVNGAAKAERHFFLDRPRYVPIDEIWRDDPKMPGLKVSLGPLIAMGLALTESDR